MRKVIYVNSKYRSSGSIEDYTITRPIDEFENPPKRVKLISACIPYTWDNLYECTKFDLNDASLTAQVPIRIDSGIYTGDELATALQTAMNATLTTSTYTVTYNSGPNTLTFSSTAAFDIIIDNQISATLFGLPIGTSPSALNTLTTGALSDLTIIPCLAIDINDDVVNPLPAQAISIELPAGNYSGATLATALQAELIASVAVGYTVIFDSENKLTITGPNDFDITIPNQESADFFGFPLGTTGSTGSTLTGTTGASILVDCDIFICSDLVRGSDNGIILWDPSITPSSTNQSQILAKVPIDKCYNSYLNFQNNTISPFYLISDRIFSGDGNNKSMRFFLKFPSGAPVTLNGYHWSAELAFEFTEQIPFQY